MNNINQEPIFIVGFPRSGTTFLQSLLATQDGLVSFPETHFFNKAVGHYPSNHQLEMDELKEVLKIIREKTDVDLTANGTGEERLNDQKYLFELLILELIRKQGLALEAGYKWIEKTPAHAMFMSKISDYYPNAKFIAIKRNPLNAVDSYFRKLVDHRKPHHDLAEEYKKTYHAIDEFTSAFPNRVINVTYEDLIMNRNATISDLMKFIGGKFNAVSIDGHTTEAKKLIREDEIWKISNTKTDKDFTQQNHKLKLKHILKIQYVLKPFMEKNRYPLEKGMYMRFYDVYRSLLKNL